MKNEKFLPTTSRIMVTIAAIVLFQMGIGAPSSAAAQGNPERPSGEQSVRDDMRAGRDLTPEEVASLKEKLTAIASTTATSCWVESHCGRVTSRKPSLA